MSAAPIPGIAAEGAVVVYLLAFDPVRGVVQMGEFPHCPMWHLVAGAEKCAASITVADVDGVTTDECTRERGHRGPHVNHDRPGLPTLAWYESRKP